MGFCREFKLIDIDVCIGAVHEYRVNLFPKTRSKIIFSKIGCCYCRYILIEL